MASSEPRKRPRSRSAKARLTPPSLQQQIQLPAHNLSEEIAKESKERAKSARAIKNKHTSSNTFVRPPSRSGGGGGAAAAGRFKSMYSQDFDGTFVPPAEIRPTSPTRRNNPHPTKQFMVWRVPSREIGAVPYEEGLELPPEYITRDANFDAIDELSGNLGALHLPPTQPTSAEYGAYLHRNKAFRQLKEPTQPRPSKELLRHILLQDPEKQEALEHWLHSASPEEQQTVLKMLRSAEEAQVSQTINKVMQPEAARAVQGWMKGADEKEKEVAVRLFSSLGSRRPERRRSLSDPMYPERPPSRKNGPTTPGPPLNDLKIPGPRSRRLSAPPGARPNPWPAGIWHHKPVRDPPPQVYHRGSLFGAVKGDTSHFNIHPEWPDYYGAGDVVH